MKRITRNLPREPLPIKVSNPEEIELPLNRPGARPYVCYNGRDITLITERASVREGMAIIYITDGNGNALTDSLGAPLTATLSGDITISVEERLKRVHL